MLYKLLRCQLVHEADLPSDVEFLDDLPEEQAAVRAGGAPEYVLKLSPGWFHKLTACALSVEA